MWNGSPPLYGSAKKSLIRLGWGMTRLTHGGQALRTVALLPASPAPTAVTAAAR